MSPRFSDNFKTRVKDMTDIVSLIGSYTALNKKGGRYWGLCPFHSEKSPSFTVDADGGRYYCFGCEKGGDAINFVMEMNGFTYPEAMEYLAERANIPIEYTQGSSPDNGEYKKKKLYTEINRQTGNFYYTQLKNNPGAQEYIKKRGLSLETVKTFAMGFAPLGGNRLYAYLKSKGYSEEDILKLGLIGKSERGCYDTFRNRLMFPILDITGNVVGFGGRVFDDSKPKYLNSPDTPIFNKHTILYNMNKAKRYIGEGKKPLIVTEGYMDVISLFDKGIPYACASLGTAFGPSHAKLIKRHTSDVVLCYDADSAGINAALRALDIFEAEGLNVRVLLLPDNDDPDSYVRKYGKDKFEKELSEAPFSTDFRLKVLMPRYDLNDIVMRANYLKKACEAVAKTDDMIKWDYYAKYLSEQTGTDQLVIKQQIIKSADQISGKTNNSAIPSNKPSENPSSEMSTKSEKIDYKELAVMKYIMHGYDNYQKFISLNGAGNLFSDGEMSSLYNDVANLYEKEKNVDITDKLMYNNIFNHLIAKIDASVALVNESELKEYVNTMLAKFYAGELKRIRQRLSDPENNSESESTLLMKEYTYIKQELLQISGGGSIE